MNWQDAEYVMKDAEYRYLIKLPEWTGFWFYDVAEGKLKVFTKTGDILNTPMINENKYRTDWEALPAEMSGLGYDFAILALKNGKRLTRRGWNTSDVYIGAKLPTDVSEMTQGYLFITVPAGKSKQFGDHGGLIENRIPWMPSNTDQWANDWVTPELAHILSHRK